MKRLSAVVLLLLCLAGCAAPRQEAAPQTLEVQSLSSLPSLPAALHLACRMEALQDGEVVSRQSFTAIQNGAGFYYASSRGDEYLFLSANPGTYQLYTRDEGGSFQPDPRLTATEDMLLPFRRYALHLNLFTSPVEHLTVTGSATVAGRQCLVAEGTVQAAPSYRQRERCAVDRETGLVLARAVSYTHVESGETFLYRFTCDTFVTDQVALPLEGIGP